MSDWTPPPVEIPPPMQQHPPEPLTYGEQVEFPMSVEDGLLLVHREQEPAEQPDLRFDRPLIAGQDEWGLHLSTGAQDHIVDVRLTVNQAAPPAQPSWDTSEKTSLALSSDVLTVSTLYAHSFAKWRLPSAGEWQVRLSRSGADRGRTVTSTASGPREQWLLEFWKDA